MTGGAIRHLKPSQHWHRSVVTASGVDSQSNQPSLAFVSTLSQRALLLPFRDEVLLYHKIECYCFKVSWQLKLNCSWALMWDQPSALRLHQNWVFLSLDIVVTLSQLHSRISQLWPAAKYSFECHCSLYIDHHCPLDYSNLCKSLFIFFFSLSLSLYLSLLFFSLLFSFSLSRYTEISVQLCQHFPSYIIAHSYFRTKNDSFFIRPE